MSAFRKYRCILLGSLAASAARSTVASSLNPCRQALAHLVEQRSASCNTCCTSLHFQSDAGGAHARTFLPRQACRDSCAEQGLPEPPTIPVSGIELRPWKLKCKSRLPIPAGYRGNSIRVWAAFGSADLTRQVPPAWPCFCFSLQLPKVSLVALLPRLLNDAPFQKQSPPPSCNKGSACLSASLSADGSQHIGPWLCWQHQCMPSRKSLISETMCMQTSWQHSKI